MGCLSPLRRKQPPTADPSPKAGASQLERGNSSPDPRESSAFSHNQNPKSVVSIEGKSPSAPSNIRNFPRNVVRAKFSNVSDSDSVSEPQSENLVKEREFNKQHSQKVKDFQDHIRENKDVSIDGIQVS